MLSLSPHSLKTHTHTHIYLFGYCTSRGGNTAKIHARTHTNIFVDTVVSAAVLFAQCPRRGSCRRRLRDADPIRQVQIVGRAAAAAGVGPASAFTPRTVKFIFFSGVVASAETLTRESVGDERKKQNKKKKENENVNKYHRNLVRARRNAARTFSYRNKKKKKKQKLLFGAREIFVRVINGNSNAIVY